MWYLLLTAAGCTTLYFTRGSIINKYKQAVQLYRVFNSIDTCDDLGSYVHLDNHHGILKYSYNGDTRYFVFKLCDDTFFGMGAQLFAEINGVRYDITPPLGTPRQMVNAWRMGVDKLIVVKDSTEEEYIDRNELSFPPIEDDTLDV
jgi:hypothetical protein